MPQKYVVYLNKKTLLFNNSQGVLSQTSVKKEFPKNSKNEVIRALNWLLQQQSEEACAHLLTCSFSDAINTLKSELDYILAAGGVVCEPENRILCIHRLGFWDLPKGKVEKDEEVSDAASREVSEETGIPMLVPVKELCRTWHIYQQRGKNILKESVWFTFFSNQKYPLIPQTSEQISEALWLTESEFLERSIDAYPAIVDVVNNWIENKQSNSLS